MAGVLAAALVAFLGGLDVYLYEDGSPLTHAAYRAAPFLDLSFSLIYVTALAIGVASVVLIARLALAASGSAHPGAGDLAALPLIIFGAPLAFWGIALRQPGAFLALVLILAGGVALMLLVTRLAVARLLRMAVAHPTAATLGACVGLVTLLLVDGGLALRTSGAAGRWPRPLRYDTGWRIRYQRTGGRLRAGGAVHLSGGVQVVRSSMNAGGASVA